MLIENLHIHDIADDGMAVGRYNDWVVFVKGAVPGDIIHARVFKKKKKYGFASLEEIVTPSEKRITPVCTHFGICGGCKWQSLDYEAQLAFKQNMVTNAFKHLAGIQYYETEPIIGCDNIYHYRNKLEYTFSNKRWFTADEMHLTEPLAANGLGFHVPGRFDKVLDIQTCHLMDNRHNDLRNIIKSFCLANDYSFYDIKSQVGLMRTLLIRTTQAGDWMVVLVFGNHDLEKIASLMQAIKNEFSFITSLQYIINTKKNDTYFDLDPVCYHGNTHIMERMDDLTFRISVKSFFQTNTAQAIQLYRKTAALANLQCDHIIYDLYTGTGTIANYIARSCKKVVGIDYVKDAIEDARQNSMLNNINNTAFYAGDMKRILNDDFICTHGQPDVVFADPPRAGMDKEVIQQLIHTGAKRIVYVSCNAATQARDVALLSEHYSVQSMQAFDMFPHTHHVENIALLVHK
ncbi:MAG: 23S rRNA (uracil(1939)-C(5))-methyltransferase RlmD [Bacteroidetes bacterium]|nr:23S rRNA (uracil(1939)-C(5))-methyltransferase RlmD [Bacteroidota bacterium]